MAGATVRVSGLQELNRAFARLEKSVATEIRTELAKVAEPVRRTAESYAFSRITNIGSRWGRMKAGTTFTNAYIAPTTRPSGGSPRPTFGTLLLTSSMLPAAKANEPLIQKGLEVWIDRITRSEGF